MLFVREYGSSGPVVIVLHGGPGAAGHMARVARGLATSYRVVEPFQRGSSSEPFTVAKHVADLHEIINFYTADCCPALLGASWGAMLALAYAAAHPSSAGPLVLVGCGTFDLAARAELERTVADRTTDVIRARLKDTERLMLNRELRFESSAISSVPQD